MRGGVSYIAKRQSKANNKYMMGYNSSRESIYITYSDANNLYSWVMCQYLLFSRLKWLNKKEIDRFDVNSIEENSCIGYILKVDLEYSSEFNELLKDYLLAPEKLKISQHILSVYFFNITKEYRIKIGGVNKLVQNLGNKSKYVVH